MKLDGIDSISEAESWIGSVISIGAGELPEPEEGSYYDFDLIGCEVHSETRFLGVVGEVVDYGGASLLRVDRDGKETLIPFARRFLRNVDTTARRIEVDLPEGLLDLGS